MKFKMLKWLAAGILSLSVMVMAESDKNDTSWIPKVDIPEPIIPKAIIPKAIIPKAPDIPEISIPEISIPEAIIPEGPDIPEISIPEISIPQIKIRENKEWAVITLAADVLFDFDRWQIRPDADKALNEVVEVLTVRYAGLPFQLHGHTDAKGTDAYNMRLSRRRVQAVKSWFIRHGIPAARITTFAHGESQPVAPNTKKDGSDNPEGRQLNRRVEIYIRKVVQSKEKTSTSDTRLKP